MPSLGAQQVDPSDVPVWFVHHIVCRHLQESGLLHMVCPVYPLQGWHTGQSSLLLLGHHLGWCQKQVYLIHLVLARQDAGYAGHSGQHRQHSCLLPLLFHLPIFLLAILFFLRPKGHMAGKPLLGHWAVVGPAPGSRNQQVQVSPAALCSARSVPRCSPNLDLLQHEDEPQGLPRSPLSQRFHDS